MKVAPLSTTDPWFRHVVDHSKAFVETLAGVPVEAWVLVEDIDIVHDGSRNFRPSLHLHGQLTDVGAPDIELPYGVTMMEFAPGHGPVVDAFYEFTDRQLAELVGRGYFREDFRIPEDMTGIQWVFPAQARIQFVSPETMDEPPVVFLEIADANDLHIDAETSGYELIEYFPDLNAEPESEYEDDASLRFEPGAEDLGVDGQTLFDDPEAPAAEQAAPKEEQAERPADRMEDLYRRNVADVLAGTAQSGTAREDDEPEFAYDPRIKRGYPLFEDGFLEFIPDENITDADGEIVFEADAALFAEERALDEAAGQVLTQPEPVKQAEGEQSRRLRRVARLQHERDMHEAAVPQPAGGASGDDLEFD